METMKTREGGFSANMLKLIAIAAMTMDHMALLFLPACEPLHIALRTVGRITGPVMFYFVAEGYHKTRDVNRYTLRLAVFAAVSYVPFILCFKGSLPNADNYWNFNVMFTLLLGLLALRVRREIKGKLPLKALLTALLLVLSVTSDWYYIGVLLILTFDMCRGDFKKQALGYCLLTLAYILPGLTDPARTLMTGQPFDVAAFTGNVCRFGMFIPVLLLSRYNGRLGRGGKAAKWSFYIFYPAHLLILGLIRLYWAG
jgi:hypothetical protein